MLVASIYELLDFEADPHQVERFVAECGLEGAKGVATPGVKVGFAELEADDELAPHLTTAFRGSAARGNLPRSGPRRRAIRMQRGVQMDGQAHCTGLESY